METAVEIERYLKKIMMKKFKNLLRF